MRYEIRMPSTIIDSIIAFTKFTIEEETGQCFDIETIEYSQAIEFAKLDRFNSVLPKRKFQINNLEYQFEANTFSNEGIVTINLNHWVSNASLLGINFKNFKKEKSILKFHFKEGMISNIQAWRFNQKTQQFEAEDLVILIDQEVNESSFQPSVEK